MKINSGLTVPQQILESLTNKNDLKIVIITERRLYRLRMKKKQRAEYLRRIGLKISLASLLSLMKIEQSCSRQNEILINRVNEIEVKSLDNYLFVPVFISKYLDCLFSAAATARMTRTNANFNTSLKFALQFLIEIFYNKNRFESFLCPLMALT